MKNGKISLSMFYGKLVLFHAVYLLMELMGDKITWLKVRA